MVGFLIRAAVVAVGLWVASLIVPGVSFSSNESLIWAALLLGIINAFVRPILVILTIPITILSLGLFLLVINGIMIMLASAVVPGFLVRGFAPAFWGAVVLALLGMVIRAVVKKA